MSIFVFTAYENNTQSLLKTWEVQESFDKKQKKKKAPVGLLFSCITVSSLISFFLFCSIFKYENGTAYVFIEHTYTGRLKKIHIYKF